MAEEKEILCTVEFPAGLAVRGGGKGKARKNISDGETPTVVEGVPLAKAMKHAHQVSAKVTGPDGEVLAAPELELTDRRPKAAAEVAEKQAGELAELRAKAVAQDEKIAMLMAALERKQDKRGPKPQG